MNFASYRSYIILGSVMLVVVALVIFMWLDARKLNQALEAKTKPKVSSDQKETETVQAQTGNARQTNRSRPPERTQPPQRRPRNNEYREVVREDPYARPSSASPRPGSKRENANTDGPPMEMEAGQMSTGDEPAGE